MLSAERNYSVEMINGTAINAKNKEISKRS
jgi:hypothetical protein